MVRTEATDVRFWEAQDDAVLNQANPVSGTIYQVLPETSNVRLITANAVVTWTVQPDPLQLYVDRGLTTIRYDQATPVSAQSYEPDIYASDGPVGQPMVVLTTYSVYKDMLFHGKILGIRAETTGGTVQDLSSRAKYERYL